MERHRIRDCFRPSEFARKAREGGLRRAIAWYLGLIAGLIEITVRFAGRKVAAQWNREATEREAVNLFRIGLPVGLAAILLAVGLGFGL